MQPTHCGLDRASSASELRPVPYCALRLPSLQDIKLGRGGYAGVCLLSNVPLRFRHFESRFQKIFVFLLNYKRASAALLNGIFQRLLFVLQAGSGEKARASAVAGERPLGDTAAAVPGFPEAAKAPREPPVHIVHLQNVPNQETGSSVRGPVLHGLD